MDTPVKSVPAASTSSPNPVSQFEDSPIFKYINGLSPIKPVNSEQSFNLLSFASPNTPSASPATYCPPKSKISCSQFSYPLKSEPTDGENEVSKSKVINNNIQPMGLLTGKADYLDSIFGLKNNASHEPSESAVDACQSTNDDPGISQIETHGEQDYLDSGMVVKVESASDEPAELSSEPHQCISSVHGDPERKADDLNDSVPQTLDSEISPEFFIQGNCENVESSFNSNLALQGIQVDQMKGVGCRWENIFVEPADQLLCDSPIEEEDPGETGSIYLDSGTLSFMENILQTSEESIDEFMNIDSIPLGSFEEHDVKVPLAHPNGAEKPSEVGQASTCAPSSDTVVPNSNAEAYNKPCPQQQEMLSRRCLIFEMSGTHYKKLMSETEGTSLISEQSVCTAVTSEKRLISSKCEVYSSVLPGIGLHLNTLARREKIVVKQEISTYKRQQISIPCTTSLHSTSSDPKPIDPALNIDSMQEDFEPSNNKGKLKENASQSSAFTGSDEGKQNSIKRKRCKSNDVEGDACKRCNCKRSKCLKLYCECFAAGLYCVDPCACQGCLNKPAFEETVLETRRLIEARNPLAFAPKVIKVPDATEYMDEVNKTPASARHKSGCNCKKSGCLKKYCECFQGGVGCSLSCRCEGCKNSFGRKDGGTDTFLREVTEAAVDNSTDVDFSEAVFNVEMEDHDSQVTPISQIGRSPSGRVGLDSHFPSFSSRLLQPCFNHGLAKVTSFSCNETLGVPPLRKMIIEDETAKGLKDDDTLTSTSVKSVSPNSKRVLPHLGPRHSPPRKFCRKLILRSIPSFSPKLPEHIDNGMSRENP